MGLQHACFFSLSDFNERGAASGFMRTSQPTALVLRSVYTNSLTNTNGVCALLYEDNRPGVEVDSRMYPLSRWR